MVEGSFRFQVGESAKGQRLDVFLAAQLREVSRSTLQRWIRLGQVQIGSLIPKPRQRLQPGEEILVTPPVALPDHLVAEPIPLDVVFEDDYLIVVNKPAGLVVHPGAGNASGTLANALAYHLESISHVNTVRPGIVHRLDKDTSGLLVVAKDDWIHEQMAAQFKQRTIDKYYRALLYGRLAPAEGSVELPIGRHPRHRVKMSTESRKPRPAATQYRVLRYLKGFSDVQAKPLTGRTHQIRVHFAALGCPVVGDALYAPGRLNKIQDPETRKNIRTLNRHFLHASRIEFFHPVRQRRLCFHSPLTADLAALLSGLEL